MTLGVNIDHIATLRQARYAADPESPICEPDLVASAAASERAGASGITIHLRADRRHIQDRDVFRLRESITTKLNLEMGNTAEILDIALRVRPEEVCLVPENRAEITTEGGLDAAGQMRALAPTVARLHAAGIRVSLFIEPDPRQIDAAHQLGTAIANATGPARAGEIRRLHEAALLAHGLGLQVNAGHGINYTNIRDIRALPHIAELNIGHSIIARALTVGLESAVAEMLALMRGTA